MTHTNCVLSAVDSVSAGTGQTGSLVIYLSLSAGESGAEPGQVALSPDIPLDAPSSQSQAKKDTYS